MFSCKYHPYIEASPDSITLLHHPEFDPYCGSEQYRAIHVCEKRHAIEVL